MTINYQSFTSSLVLFPPVQINIYCWSTTRRQDQYSILQLNMQTFKIFFISVACAIVFGQSNGQSERSELQKSYSLSGLFLAILNFFSLAESVDEYVGQIRGKIADSTDIAVSDQKKKNAEQSLTGSILNGLLLFLKFLLVPGIIVILNGSSFLSNIFGSAFDGLSKSGLFGLLGGLARGILNETQQITGTKIGETILKGK